jgi:hypothetical protein
MQQATADLRQASSKVQAALRTVYDLEPMWNIDLVVLVGKLLLPLPILARALLADNMRLVAFARHKTAVPHFQTKHPYAIATLPRLKPASNLRAAKLDIHVMYFYWSHAHMHPHINHHHAGTTNASRAHSTCQIHVEM